MAPDLIGQLSQAVPTITELINGDASIMKKGSRKRILHKEGISLSVAISSGAMMLNILAFSLRYVSVHKPGIQD